MSQLQIAEDFSLPLDAGAMVFAILAKRGAGKTYTGMVMAEEMVAAGIQICVIDPLGVWWGLRASADGKQEGLPIAVLGGSHADVPLTREMGRPVARFLVKGHASIILDLSEFDPNAAVGFVADFAAELYKLNREPLHLFIDEADEFMPQTSSSKEAQRSLVAMNRVFRRGRQRGLAGTFMTQRPTVIDKNILNQIDVLVAMRFSGPKDFKAIEEWVDRVSTPEQKEALRTSLPTMHVGTAWFYSPAELSIFQKVKVRQRKTFDSSAAPKIGKSIAQPDVVAEIDLSSLKDALDESLKQAEHNDVKALQRKVLLLQRRLDAKPETPIERVEVPVIEAAQIEQLKTLAEAMMEQARDLIACSEDIMATLARAQVPGTIAAANGNKLPKPENYRPGALVVSKTEPPTVRRVAIETGDEDDEISLIAGEEKILYTAASHYPMRFSRAQLGELSGYAYKGGTFGNYFGRLKRFGLLIEQRGEIEATQLGLAMAGVVAPMPPADHGEMMALWLDALPTGPGKLLTALTEHYPHYVERETLGTLAGYAASGGTFGNYLGILRRNDLIDEDRSQGIRAASLLFPEMA